MEITVFDRVIRCGCYGSLTVTVIEIALVVLQVHFMQMIDGIELRQTSSIIL